MLLLDLLPYLLEQIMKLEEVNVFSDGITNILDLPEYNDVVKAREFIIYIAPCFTKHYISY